MIERRTYPRHRTFIQGRIYFHDKQSSIDCTVRDLSDHGARLDGVNVAAFPDTVELYLPQKDELFDARVIWRKGNAVGVSWNPDSRRKLHRQAS